MHDIKLEKSGSKKFWDEIKNNKNSFARKYIVQNIHLNMV